VIQVCKTGKGTFIFTRTIRENGLVTKGKCDA